MKIFTARDMDDFLIISKRFTPIKNKHTEPPLFKCSSASFSPEQSLRFQSNFCSSSH